MMQENPIPSLPGSGTGSETMDAKKLEAQPTPEPEESDGSGIRKRIFTHFTDKIETKAGYIPLLICCFVTGLTDGTVYNGMEMPGILELRWY